MHVHIDIHMSILYRQKNYPSLYFNTSYISALFCSFPFLTFCNLTVLFVQLKITEWIRTMQQKIQRLPLDLLNLSLWYYASLVSVKKRKALILPRAYRRTCI